MMSLPKLLAASAALSLATAAFAQEAKPAAPAPAPAITVTPYGIIQAGLYKNDGLFGLSTYNTNTAAVVTSNATDYPTWARSENEGAFIGSVRQSRVGVNAAVPMENLIGANVTGKIEFDFMGPGAVAWGSAPLRLRHAYLNADWSFGADKLYVLFGQTDVLVNPIHPESVAYLASPLFQLAGNLHRRSPQLRAGYVLNMDAFVVKLEGAIVSPADLDAQNKLSANDYGASNRSGHPEYEARLGFSMKPMAGFGGTIGAGYATFTRTYDGVGYDPVTNPLSRDYVEASLIGVDAIIDLTEYGQLRGEWFQGKGIDDTFAGVASYSVTPYKTTPYAGAHTAVESSGYWAQAVIKPIPAVWILAGLGQEKIDAATYLPAAAGSNERLQNDMLSGGVEVNLNKAWKVGLEYTQTTSKARAATTANLAATTEFTATQWALSTQLKF